MRDISSFLTSEKPDTGYLKQTKNETNNKLQIMKKTILVLASLAVTAGLSQATTIYIGDRTTATDSQENHGTLDTGPLTYIFAGTNSANDYYENTSGGLEQVTVSNIHIHALGTGNLTPFFALYSGSDHTDAQTLLGANYEIVDIGSAIAVSGPNGQKSLAYSATFTIAAGAKLVAGFYSDAGIVAYNQGSEADPTYITNGNTIGSVGNSPVNANFNAATRNRSYAVAFETDIVLVPEPSSTALLGLGGLALIMRRRK